jgi:hypothetical protein
MSSLEGVFCFHAPGVRPSDDGSGTPHDDDSTTCVSMRREGDAVVRIGSVGRGVIERGVTEGSPLTGLTRGSSLPPECNNPPF